MKDEQEFSPKYWIVHFVDNDDVIISTMSKKYDESIKLYQRGNYGNFYEDEENGLVKCELFEINKVKL